MPADGGFADDLLEFLVQGLVATRPIDGGEDLGEEERNEGGEEFLDASFQGLSKSLTVGLPRLPATATIPACPSVVQRCVKGQRHPSRWLFSAFGILFCAATSSTV